MTKEQAIAHGKRYSKSFNNGVWKEDPEAMCLKTVLKLLLSKYGILSIEMQRAIKFDQGVIRGDISQMDNIEDLDDADVEYIDNPQNAINEAKAQEVADKFAAFLDVTNEENK